MYKNIFACLALLVLIIGCQEKPKDSSSKADGKSSSNKSYKKAFSDGAYNFQIEYNNRLDSSYFDVLYRGKKVSRDAYKGRITKDFLKDLNKNRKKEVYLVVENKGVSDVFGYRFEGGKPIKILKEPNRRNPTSIKSSSINIERNQLIERYTYLSKEGTDAYGESRYNLVKREGELVLLPQGWQPFEIENLIGEYVSRDEENAGNFKVLLIGERVGGRWNVDIKVKSTNGQKILCQFSGLGEFVEKDLFVPMNQSNSDMEGTLQIQFVDGFANIYTEEHSDYQEMAAICENKVSIAGNFRKIKINE